MTIDGLAGQGGPYARLTLTGVEQSMMLLIESLIHGLIDRSVLSPTDAIEIIDRAIEVRRDISRDADESLVALDRSVACLVAISGSLASDVDQRG